MTKNKKQDMDILQLWKQYTSQFLMVIQMTYDILSVPVSIIIFNLVLSINDNILEDQNCSLFDEMIKVITCMFDCIGLLILILEQFFFLISLLIVIIFRN